ASNSHLLPCLNRRQKFGEALLGFRNCYLSHGDCSARILEISSPWYVTKEDAALQPGPAPGAKIPAGFSVWSPRREVEHRITIQQSMLGLRQWLRWLGCRQQPKRPAVMQTAQSIMKSADRQLGVLVAHRREQLR